MISGESLPEACGHRFWSVQSALTHLLITSGPHDMFSHLSIMYGSISIIELLQFTTVHSFWASLGKASKQTNTHNCIGIEKFQGTLQVGQS